MLSIVLVYAFVWLSSAWMTTSWSPSSSKKLLHPTTSPPRLEVPVVDADILHVVVLVHGHRGMAADLSYMREQMQQVAHDLLRRDDALSDEGSEPSDDTEVAHPEEEKLVMLRQDVVVRAAVCNEGKTEDGVERGGQRLVQEILQILRQELKKRSTKKLTLSVLGNSLGGLYGRYALGKIAAQCADRDGTYRLDRKYELYFNVFCTTATPHLGIAGHTFLPLPRTAEIGVAHALGDTGKDLFRLNDLMKEMATSPEYLKSLGRFRKRIAYANAFSTDFAVPAGTAAFLNADSEYPHHFMEDDSDVENPLIVDDNGLVIATLHTPPKHAGYVDETDEDDLRRMSSSLDALGWKKVFVDVRKEIPKISLPRIRKDDDSGDDERADIDELRRQGVAPSKDVAAAVTRPIFEDKFHWPMGHNMMVAFSRSRWSAYVNRAGRPLVDSLVKEFVEDVLAWAEDQEPTF